MRPYTFINNTSLIWLARVRVGISAWIYWRRCWCLTDYGRQFYVDDDLIACEANEHDNFSGSFRYVRGGVRITRVWSEIGEKLGQQTTKLCTAACCDSSV